MLRISLIVAWTVVLIGNGFGVRSAWAASRRIRYSVVK